MSCWPRGSGLEAQFDKGLYVLTEREKSILNLIVGDYIRDATPVASKAIFKRHGLNVSPATIRNDVVELEHAGFITRPHPSAGSVPLDKGYRLYVESIGASMPEAIPPETRDSIRQRFVEVERDIEEWCRVAAAILAGLVGNMAIATFPKAKESRVRHIDLVSLQDILVLMIVVFEQAQLRKQLIRLHQPADSGDLRWLANKLSSRLQGLTWREIESSPMELSPLEEEVVETAVVMLREEDRSQYRDHYVDGMRNLLAQPEFVENEAVQSFIQGAEDGSLAQAILDEAPDAEVVRVVIGQENQGDMLRPLSVVIGQYGIPGEAEGVIGAIGPVRMEYSRAIASVELMTYFMGDLVAGVHGR